MRKSDADWEADWELVSATNGSGLKSRRATMPPLYPPAVAADGNLVALYPPVQRDDCCGSARYHGRRFTIAIGEPDRAMSVGYTSERSRFHTATGQRGQRSVPTAKYWPSSDAISDAAVPSGGSVVEEACHLQHLRLDRTA